MILLWAVQLVLCPAEILLFSDRVTSEVSRLSKGKKRRLEASLSFAHSSRVDFYHLRVHSGKSRSVSQTSHCHWDYHCRPTSTNTKTRSHSELQGAIAIANKSVPGQGAHKSHCEPMIHGEASSSAQKACLFLRPRK